MNGLCHAVARILAAAALSCGGLLAQAKGVTVGADPYTAGDPAALAAAGYVALGKLAWTDQHDTVEIENLLGELPYCWIETEHFRILSTLPPIEVTDKKLKATLKPELDRLRAKLPRVKKRVRELDRWLRAHLYAQRCEELYADFVGRLGHTKESFPATELLRPGRPYMGVGPYLGQARKFLVMLFEREAPYARYTEKYLGERVRFPRRWSFGQRGSLWFGTSIEFYSELAGDTPLHCHLVCNLIGNFVDGYKHYRHDVPVWWRYGLGAWYCRRIDPEFNNFERVDQIEPDVRDESRWYSKAYLFVKNQAASPLPTMLTRMTCEEFKFRDYVGAWSLVEFLMQRRGDAGFAAFMGHLKTPTDAPMLAENPTVAAILKQQAAALQVAWEFDTAQALEDAWRAYVLKTYKRVKE